MTPSSVVELTPISRLAASTSAGGCKKVDMLRFLAIRQTSQPRLLQHRGEGRAGPRPYDLLTRRKRALPRLDMLRVSKDVRTD
jgi:hypothetical protein